MMQLKTRMKVSFRWMVRRDLPFVLEIEAASFERPWDEDDFLGSLRQRNIIGMVAERGGRIVGYMVYRLGSKFGRRHAELLHFAVHPEFRCHGIGRQLVEKLIGNLRQSTNRKLLLIPVRETNLGGQRFLRAIGIKADMVLPGHFEDGEDAYNFSYRLSDGEATI